MRRRFTGIDERQLRFERGVAAVLLFGGYVWERDLVIPVVAVGLTIALIPSLSLRPFGVPYEQFVAPRLRNERARTVLSTVARADDLALAGVLALATVLIVLGFGTIARIIGLATGGLAMLEAAAGLWIGATIDRRLRDRLKRSTTGRG